MSTPVRAIVRDHYQANDGLRAVCQVGGASIRIVVPVAARLRDGQRVEVIGSGYDWRLADPEKDREG